MKPKCRCYINSKYYARVVSGKINGTLRGYEPCPIHEPTPMETEAYEPIDGAEVEININEFQERLNQIP